MSHLNPKVDLYIVDGCGRCPLGGTPDCKVNKWTDILVHLRMIVLECGLAEELKWGVPCYTCDGKNLLIIGAFKEHCSLSFFNGALLKDTEGILVKPGEDSQSTRYLKFTNLKEVKSKKAVIKSYIREAIGLMKSGKKVVLKKIDEYPIPDELELKFKEVPALKTAFRALTPGRQRGYLIHFFSAKQSQTRVARIEKCMQMIFDGRGMGE